MRNLPPTERPRERCLLHGPDTLSLRECLALILTPGPPGLGAMGLAGRILEGASGASLALSPSRRQEEDSNLERAFFVQLESRGQPLPELRGLGDAGRARLLAVFEIARRYQAFRARITSSAASNTRGTGGDSGRTTIGTSLSTVALRRIPSERLADSREWLGFVPLFGAGGGSVEVGPFCLVERGTRTHVNVEPMELFARILALRPRGIWLFHNHPSGRAEASEEDQLLTRNVARVCRQLGLECLGHGIVTSTGASCWIDGLADESGLSSPAHP